MTDIIEDLRKIERANDVPPKGHASLAGRAANEIAHLREFADWVDAWTSNPVGAYSSHALMGLFAATQDKLAALRRS